jgi:hypothetical protein
MAKKKGNRKGLTKQYFEDKRTKTFESLDTVAKDWEHATIVDFQPMVRLDEKTKAEKIRWIPVFTIPDGYKNPLKVTDEKNDESRHCQLCDHFIIDYGVILHHTKKYSLIVGMDCYELYEDDDARNVRLTLLERLEDEFFTKRLAEQKDRLRAELDTYLKTKKSDANIAYNFYSTIQRNQFVDWSKAKFYNFVAKWGHLCRRIGFEPKMADITPTQYKKFLQNILISDKEDKYNNKIEQLMTSNDHTNFYTERAALWATFRAQQREIKGMGLAQIKQLVAPVKLV